jgi:uncharacterized YigZ family protein
LHRVSDEIRGSRFVTTAARARDAHEAREFIERIRAEFHDATHNCWAYVAGAPGDASNSASSDDGEPGGTAGIPILNVLLNSGVGDVVVVVTRYYGGVKLGRGGLARAYGGGARRVLDEMPLSERIRYTGVDVTVKYSFVEPVRRIAAGLGCRIRAERFGADAAFELDVPEEAVDELKAELTQLTRGKVSIRKHGKGKS